jgi:hypothetical protein
MARKHILILSISIVILAIILFPPSNNRAFSNEAYGEFVAPAPTGAKFVQIEPIVVDNFNYHDLVIETLGYREIRVYAQVASRDIKNVPVPKNAVLKLAFMHQLTGLGIPYQAREFRQQVSALIDGWAIESIYGKDLKLAIDADNLPKGRYTLQLSYYLLP